MEFKGCFQFLVMLSMMKVAYFKSKDTSLSDLSQQIKDAHVQNIVRIEGHFNNGSNTSILTNFFHPQFFQINLKNETIQLTEEKAKSLTQVPKNVFVETIQFIFDGIFFTIGVSGNLLIIAAVMKNPKLRSLQNYFLLNLVITDLITLLLLLPIFLISQYISWPFGSFICRYIIPVADCIPAVSILTLVVVSVDRYRIIIHSLPKALSHKDGTVIIAAIWLLSYLIIGLPLSFMIDVREGTLVKKICCPLWSNEAAKHTYYGARIGFFYILPSAIILFCYIRIRITLHDNMTFLHRSLTGVIQAKRLKHHRKIMNMFFTIFIMFVVSFLPLNLLATLILYSKHFAKWKYVLQAMQVANTFVFANSVCNPIVLYILSHVFRSQFRRWLPFLKFFQRRRNELWNETRLEEENERNCRWIKNQSSTNEEGKKKSFSNYAKKKRTTSCETQYSNILTSNINTAF